MTPERDDRRAPRCYEIRVRGHLGKTMRGAFGIVTVSASDEIVAAAPVAEAGIAGGITSTAQQLGGVIGTSLLGSLLASRVASTLAGHLTAAGAPIATAHQLVADHNITQLVGQGVAPPVRGVSAPASSRPSRKAGSGSPVRSDRAAEPACGEPGGSPHQ
jgi:hypothetical protein